MGDTNKDADATEKPFGITNIRTYVPLTLDLEELNYDAWRELFEACCVSFGVQHHLTETTPANPSADWLKIDSLVKLWIYGTLTKPLLQMVLKKGVTAHSVWTSLESLFRDNKDARAMQLDHELRTIQIGDMTIIAYCQKLKVISDLLANIDQPVSEKNLVIYMINGLNEKYDQIAGIIRHQNPLPSFLQARSMLLVEESHLAKPRSLQGHHRDNASAPSVLHIGSGDQNRNSNQHRGNDRANNRRGNDRRGGDRRSHQDRRGGDRRQQLSSDRQQPPTSWGPWAVPSPWAPPAHWLHSMGYGQQPWAQLPPPTPAWAQKQGAGPSSRQQRHAHQPAAYFSSWPSPNSAPTPPAEQPTLLPEAFQAMSLQDPLNSDLYMDT